MVAETAYVSPDAVRIGAHWMAVQTGAPFMVRSLKRNGNRVEALQASKCFFASCTCRGNTKSKYDIPAILSCSTPTRSQKYVLAYAILPLRSTISAPLFANGISYLARAKPLAW